MSCDYCPKVFQHLSNLRMHERSVHPETCPMHCGNCNAPFHSQVTLDRHQSECTDEMEEIVHGSDEGREMDDVEMEDALDHDDAVNADQHRMALASERAVGGRDGSYPCMFCDRAFHQVSNLNAHERNQHPEHCPLHCQYCAKPFHSLNPMERHVAQCAQRRKPVPNSLPGALAVRLTGSPIVVRLPNYKRNNPDYVSVNPSTSSRRVIPNRTSSLTPTLFPCQFCTRIFNRRYLRYNHEEQSHPKALPHRCPNCNTGFKMKSGLDSHVTACTIFVCQECGKEFASRFLFDRHLVETRHMLSSDVPLECPICNKSFKWVRSYDLHLERQHKGFKKRSSGAFGMRTKKRCYSSISRPPRINIDDYETIEANVYVCPHPKMIPITSCNCPVDRPCTDSNCVNRRRNIECTADSCHLEGCTNQAMTRGSTVTGLSLGKDQEGGRLLSSTEPIVKDAFIIEFVGEILDPAARRTRVHRAPIMIRVSPYLSIDASHKGNLSRYMQHSDAPNCMPIICTVAGETRVGIFALTDIAPGTPLSYDYIAGGRVGYDNVLSRFPGDGVVLPVTRYGPSSPLDIYDKEKLPSQFQFDMVVNYQLDNTLPAITDGVKAGIFLGRNYRRAFSQRYEQSREHFRVGQAQDITANMAAFDQQYKGRNRRSSHANDHLRLSSYNSRHGSPMRVGARASGDARVIMPPVSLLARCARPDAESSSDESSFDADASAAIAMDVDIVFDMDNEYAVYSSQHGREESVSADDNDDNDDESDSFEKSSTTRLVNGQSPPLPSLYEHDFDVNSSSSGNDTGNDDWLESQLRVTGDIDHGNNVISASLSQFSSAGTATVKMTPVAVVSTPKAPPQRFQCSLCSRSFTLKCNFQKHLISHGAPNPWSCPTCHLPFLRASDLQRHLTVTQHGALPITVNATPAL